MRVERRTYDGVIILSLIGELDAYSLPSITSGVDLLLEQGVKEYVLDLSGLTFVSSSALGYVVRTKKAAVAAGGDAILVRPSKFVVKILSLLGLEDFFFVMDDVVAGVRHFRPDSGPDAACVRDQPADELPGGNAILFRPEGAQWEATCKASACMGKIASTYSDGLLFRWKIPPAAAGTPLHAGNLEEILRVGCELRVKFRQPMVASTRYFETVCLVRSLERVSDPDAEPPVDEARIRLEYTEMPPEDRAVLDEFTESQDGFRKEVK